MKKVLFKSKYLQLINEGSWEYVKRSNCTGIVIIFAMTDDKKVILVEQHRVPVGRDVIEFPAGLVGDLELKEEESLEDAAFRELVEETGYQAKKMKKILHGPASAGLCAECLTVFRASGLKKVGKGGGDEMENITVHEVPLKKAFTWLKRQQAKGKFVDPKVYAGLYFLEKES